MARPVQCERSAQDRVCDFEESYRQLTPEEAIAEAQRCVRCGCCAARCETACPLRSPICRMMQLVAAGQFGEAARLLRQRNNSAEICARVCPHDLLCEGHCALAASGEAVAIGAVERFVVDWALQQTPPALTLPPHRTGKHVAIVGSGPSGLACAEELAKKGHKATVYEALPQPGGLLIYGIPGFKISRAVVARRLVYLRALGVDFICNTHVGRDCTLDDLLSGGHHAIFVATGATRPKEPGIEGRHLANVVDPLSFIARNIVPCKDLPPDHARADDLRGKRVVVVGGGDTAMGVSRAAVRKGAASVTCVYRRDEASMPGSRLMVRWAREEGVTFRFLTAPVRLIGDGSGRLSKIECVRMSDPEPTGGRGLVPAAGSNFILEADVATLACGFDPSRLGGADDDLAVNPNGTYAVDAAHMTSRRGVFAGGCIVSGMGSVVNAVKAGCDAADTMDRFLAGA